MCVAFRGTVRLVLFLCTSSELPNCLRVTFPPWPPRCRITAEICSGAGSQLPRIFQADVRYIQRLNRTALRVRALRPPCSAIGCNVHLPAKLRQLRPCARTYFHRNSAKRQIGGKGFPNVIESRWRQPQELELQGKSINNIANRCSQHESV